MRAAVDEGTQLPVAPAHDQCGGIGDVIDDAGTTFAQHFRSGSHLPAVFPDLVYFALVEPCIEIGIHGQIGMTEKIGSAFTKDGGRGAMISVQNIPG